MSNVWAKKDKKILVALSGGVDSSVAALLLKKSGYYIEGAYMRCWSEGPYCSADADEADAVKVAATLGIPFQVFNFEKKYRQTVIDYFYSEYEAGRTPNPDVMCNKEIKFGLFLKKAKKLGFDYIATGHYARISNQRPVTRDQPTGNRRLAAGNSNKKRKNEDGLKQDHNGYDYHLLKGGDASKDQSLGQYQLLAGVDRDKDQSYFLYLVGQDQLAHVLFPLGGLKKTQVRELAKKYKLPTAKKPDSMGICFVGPTNIKEFLMQKIKTRQGDIVSVDGKLLGKHIGLPYYTIGQREGLGISAPVPYYVAGKKTTTNTLVVAPFGHQALFKNKFTVRKIHWVSGSEPRLREKVGVKLRYRAKSAPSVVKKIKRGTLEVELAKSERAITPGQSAVFYQGQKILGGGVIHKVI